MLGHNEWGTFEASVVNKFSAEEITPITSGSGLTTIQERIDCKTDPSSCPTQITYKPDLTDAPVIDVPIWYQHSSAYGSVQSTNNPTGWARGDVYRRTIKPWPNIEITQKRNVVLHDRECSALKWLTDEEIESEWAALPCSSEPHNQNPETRDIGCSKTSGRRGNKIEQYRKGECLRTYIIETLLIELIDGERHHTKLTTQQKVWMDKDSRSVKDTDGVLSITPYGVWDTHSLDEVLKFAHDKIKSSEEVVEEDLPPLDPEIEPVIIEEEEEEEEPETTVEEEEEPIIIYKPPPCGTPMGGPCAEPSKLPFILGLLGLLGVVTYIGTKGD